MNGLQLHFRWPALVALMALTAMPLSSRNVRADDGISWAYAHELRRSVTSQPDQGITALAIAPDALTVAIGHRDGFAQRWDLQSGTVLQILEGHSQAVFSLAHDASGKHLISASADRTSRIWSLSAPSNPITLDGHQGKITMAAFSADGKLALTGADDATAAVWDARTGQMMNRLQGHRQYLSAAHFLPETDTLVTASADGTVRIWSRSSGKQMAVLQSEGYAGPVDRVVIDPKTPNRLAVVRQNSVELWDTNTRRIETTLSELDGKVGAVIFRPTSAEIIIGQRDGTIGIWSTMTGKKRLSLSGHMGSVSAMRMIDGDLAVSSSHDGSVRIWNVQSGMQVAELLKGGLEITHLSVEPKAGLIAASDGFSLHVWTRRDDAPAAGSILGLWSGALKDAGQTGTNGFSFLIDLVSPTQGKFGLSNRGKPFCGVVISEGKSVGELLELTFDTGSEFKEVKFGTDRFYPNCATFGVTGLALKKEKDTLVGDMIEAGNRRNAVVFSRPR